MYDAKCSHACLCAAPPPINQHQLKTGFLDFTISNLNPSVSSKRDKNTAQRSLSVSTYLHLEQLQIPNPSPPQPPHPTIHLLQTENTPSVDQTSTMVSKAHRNSSYSSSS